MKMRTRSSLWGSIAAGLISAGCSGQSAAPQERPASEAQLEHTTVAQQEPAERRDSVETDKPYSAPVSTVIEQRVHIIPSQSIGPLSIGTRVAELPRDIRATINHGIGEYESIRFSVGDNGVVDDVWVSNLFTFPRELVFEGRSVPRVAKEAELRRFFGPCHPGPLGRGGRTYICDSGVVLTFGYLPTDEGDEREELSCAQLRVGAHS